MVIFKTTLIVITALLLIINGMVDAKNYKERFVVNGLLLGYLIYLLFS